MKNAIKSIVDHPIATSIVISVTLSSVANIIREFNKICNTCKK